jgi:hypothetical protein
LLWQQRLTEGKEIQHMGEKTEMRNKKKRANERRYGQDSRGKKYRHNEGRDENKSCPHSARTHQFRRDKHLNIWEIEISKLMHILLFLFLSLIFDGTPSRHTRGHTQWIDRSTEDAKSISCSLTCSLHSQRQEIPIENLLFFLLQDGSHLFFSISEIMEKLERPIESIS